MTARRPRPAPSRRARLATAALALLNVPARAQPGGYFENVVVVVCVNDTACKNNCAAWLATTDGACAAPRTIATGPQWASAAAKLSSDRALSVAAWGKAGCGAGAAQPACVVSFSETDDQCHVLPSGAGAGVGAGCPPAGSYKVSLVTPTWVAALLSVFCGLLPMALIAVACRCPRVPRELLAGCVGRCRARARSADLKPLSPIPSGSNGVGEGGPGAVFAAGGAQALAPLPLAAQPALWLGAPTEPKRALRRIVL